ncbi:pyruvate:ferredoxin (flavodoxin) oxidoreductase [Acanthamoeba castellanii str. Neff]|uniref:Pyruvate:ferredoxin (Flavodoxin) oxidoreductase n=1 Tax=Acanthamoeba castellanii (strain ATCC 30010 / Neff) TaxID=1257118 RepID=L8GS75_ACACF|nr:pyruvate:ferredoxin (flavodoxin) oxidoreductase [Acanthamoeba castellanii str. Neff]ELR14981.1 pyruvate:ferredoxin (flavodoxin) oxidoreductase [Acanthamoeba castellanii str. Neff]
MNRLFARHTRPIVAQRTFPLSSAGTLRALSTPRWTAGPLRRLHGAVPMDGNTAAAHVAYGLSDIHAIYPITPSSQMGELADKWSAEGRLNAFGNTPRVIEMQSEMGAAGTLHGAAVGGALVSTFTASQGLLLMIPNLYRVAGELMPAVFHVTARAISGQGLSIYGDHSDVMAVKQTGVAMLASASPQEAMDLALVAHLSSIRSSVPFVHFFDGFRTSHEINTVEPIKYEDMRKLLDEEALEQFRRRGMNPETPNLRGLIDGPEHYFQQVEAANTILDGVLPVVEGYLDEVHKLTGRKYGLFDYHGHPEPRHVIVACGSSVSTVEEAVNHRNAQGERVGLIKVRLWRPFSIKHLVDALPKSVEKVAVIDRVRDYLASGGPLFQEVCTSLMMGGRRDVQLVNGRYGLGSKDFTPGMALAIFENLKQDQPLHNFVVGIKDDVTHKSLTVTEEPDTLPAGTKQSIFWGIGGDGTVGANEEAIKLIVENSNMYGQGYFAYSAHKSGGVTVSHLRFGEKPINSTYQVQNADLIAVHTTPYLKKFPSLLGPLKEGGTVILNSPWNDVAHLDRMLPDFVKRRIARRKARLINVDATAIAHEAGLRGRINMVMQAAFFKASEVLPLDVARAELRRVIDAQYARKGRDVLERNYAALDQGLARTVEVAYPDAWAECRDDVADYIVPDPADAPEQLRKVLRPTQRMEGDSLPVSAFDPRGAMPSGTSKYEKRGIAPAVAQWTNPDTCTQCNLCSALCPHAAIRPFLFTQEEAGSAPEGWEGRKAVGKAGKSYQYRVQVSPYDCTGCDVPFVDALDRGQARLWDFAAERLPIRSEVYPKESLKGSQFAKPCLEFSGACAGCGETPVVKLLTQLFGDELYIANATGCSIVWGGMFPWSAYTTNERGHGPAWGHSLFEDAAEYGFGIRHAVRYRREALRCAVQRDLAAGAYAAEHPALAEAEAFDGPSLVIAYAPCIAHGIKAGISTEVEEAKRAIKAGYHILYRYNPSLVEQGMNPLSLDSSPPDDQLLQFLRGENRYEALRQQHPELTDEKQRLLVRDVADRYRHYALLKEQLEPKDDGEEEEEKADEAKEEATA